MEILVVEIDRVYVGIPTSDVAEVVRAARLSPAPGASATLKGLLNLRGEVIPVVAMRTLLGLVERDNVATDHFIVLRTHSTAFAVHVDRAIEILDVPGPAANRSDQEFAESVPLEGFGVVHIHGANSLWTKVGLRSASGEPSAQPCGETSLP